MVLTLPKSSLNFSWMVPSASLPTYLNFSLRSVSALTRTSDNANKPMASGTTLTPLCSLEIPKVSLGTPPIGSEPMRPKKSPIDAAKIPFERELLLRGAEHYCEVPLTFPLTDVRFL